MRDICHSPVRIDPAHEQPSPRRETLAAEARRLSRRRAVTLAVAARCREIAEQAIDQEAAILISTRALKRATDLHIRFHRALDALVASGGFDEAIAIVRERQLGSRF
jgi:hypothetical protein